MIKILNIKWPKIKPIISKKDKSNISLKNIKKNICKIKFLVAGSGIEPLTSGL